MKKLSIIALLLTCFFGYSQELPKIIPPTPEATSLAKFIETPISHYTGTANVQIPIYTIKEKDIEIPISLNYHTRGLKVEEIAPRVGLGWALSYGGSISRQTRGKADEDTYGYFNNSSSFKTFFSDFNTRINVKQTYELYNDYDHYPDKFLINANGIGGSFVYDYEDKKPVLKHYKDLQVETLWNSTNANNNFEISGFIVTNKQGVKYYFGVSADGNRSAISYDKVVKTGQFLSPTNIINIQQANGDFFPSSWQLMDVISPKGTHVKFYYSNPEGANYYRRSYDKSESTGEVTSYFNKIISYEYQLKEIQFSQGKLIFNPSNNPREDISDSYSLDNVTLFDKHGKKIKETKFNYEYTQASSSTNQLYRLIELDPKANKRLFLKSVLEKNAQGINIPPYEFTYNSQVLPSRFSTSQDVWGNYNGANNGAYISFFNDSNNNNRRVDTIKSQAGILEEIKHPTGGKTKFVYEHNRGNFASSSSNMLLEPINPISKKVLLLTRNDFTYNNGIYELNNIVIPRKISSVYRINCFHLSDPNAPIVYPDCIFNFRMKKVNDTYTTTMEVETGSFKQLFPTTINSEPTGNFTFFVHPKTIPGVVNPHQDINFDFEIRIEYDVLITNESTYGEGKRIKKIETYNSNDDLVTEKEYSYKNGLASSGIINGFPHFISKNENGHIIKWGNMPGSPLSSFQGNSIGYRNVLEYLGSKENNSGKIEYDFTFTEDGGTYYEFPYQIPNDMEWLRGKPLEINHYKKKNNEYELLKKTENTYLYGNSPGDTIGMLYSSSNFIFKPTSITLPLATSLTNINHKRAKSKTLFRMPLFRFTRSLLATTPDADSYKIYYLTGGTADLVKTSETNYHDSGNITTQTKYLYDYANHYQLAGSEFTNSKGELYKTNNNYSILSSPFRVLPTRTKSYKGNVKLSEQNTIYNINYLPNKIQTSKGTNALEDRIIFHSYDDKGNPKEVSKKDGTHVVYIWGYNQTQPIAKIENATYAEVEIAIASISNTDFNTLLKIQNVSNIDNDRTLGELGNEGNLRKSLRLLRETSGLSKSLITTYTYDPLIGVTSITDPRGKTIYYLYDSFNRLQYVKDNEGNILSENQYNYKN